MVGSSTKRGVVLTRRDRALLAELRSLRVVDREQAKLVGPFHSTARANARLLALTRAGYMKRTFVGTISGGRKAVYFLPGSHPQKRRGPLTAEEAFAHQLAVNAVHLAFKHTPPPGGGVSFVSWRGFDAQPVLGIPLIPDGLVELRTPAGSLAAFVEVDRGTETLRVWERKVSLYLDLASSGAFRQLLTAEHFRVLVVAETCKRRDQLQAEIKRQTTKLFWLSTTGEVDRAGIWDRVWTRPGAEGPSQLIKTLSTG
jgi:hypothetical protein